jgi:signal transduction histidine kinase/ligand-binding sensor domain-containing protein
MAGLRTVQLSTLLCGILLAWGTGAYALDPALDVSQYAHTAWKIRDGFTKGEIRSITQTPDGFIWLGTEFGLLRFDGVRAVPWQPPPDQHLPSSNILSLLAARDGTLWIGTFEGLVSWKDGKLTQYERLAGHYIFKILEDHEGTIWASGLTTPAGKLCAIRDGSVQCYGEDGALGRGAFQLYEDSKANLWAGVKTGLWRWKPGPPKFYLLPGEPDGIQGLGEDVDGVLLVGWKAGIHRFVDGKTEAYSLPGSMHPFQARRLVRDRDGGLWIGTGDRGVVHVHNGKTDVFSSFDGLSSDDVYSLFEDREGNIWVSTINGLDRFRDFAVATLSAKQGLSNARVGSVLADRDGSIVWLGTYGGLNRWNNGQITSYGKDSPQAQRRANTMSGSDKREGKVDGLVPHSLFQDDHGRVWVSTLDGFGYLENGRSIPLSGVPGGTVLSITQDRAGHLWVANEHLGLFHLDSGREVEQIPWARLGHKDHASTIIADPMEGGLWLGFHYGGVAYFEDGQVRVAYTATNGLGEGRVNALQFDRDGALWVATDGGLSRLKNGRLATLTSQTGLPCDAVHWVTEDDDRSFWLKMACGLVRIARPELDAWTAAVDKGKDMKKQIQATVFDTSDGVRSSADSNHYSPQVAKTSDGRIWFLPWDGVSIVDPHHLPFNKLPPPVQVEQITADRKVYWQTWSYDASSLPPRLPPLVRDLTIDYTALSLVAPEKVRFRVKLEGWDHDWKDAGNDRKAFYSNLPPRRYRFRVMACNNSGVWNEAGTFLDFSIAPAYYQTNWFRALCVAAFLALLWGLYQLRLQQLAREFSAGLEARVNERTRIARELHDSLLQGFQGLMFRLQAVRDLLPGRASEAMQALDIALERGDKAIAEGRDTVLDLREPIIGDSDISQALTALSKELALQSGNGLVPCVRVLLEGKQRELNPMLRDEIYRIGREALRNAFRHARAQKIEAEITYSDSEFLLHVRDDGGGIDPEVVNQGARAGHWGLPGMRERAKSFGGKVEVWSEHGAGTEIELSVPGAIAYGKSEPRRRFWFWRKKNEETNGQRS